MATILAPVTPLMVQVCFRLSRSRGSPSQSLRVTRPPHLAATTPGTAVPAPNCYEFKWGGVRGGEERGEGGERRGGGGEGGREGRGKHMQFICTNMLS